MSGPYQALSELIPPPPVAGSLLQSAGTLAGEWRSGVSMPAHQWVDSVWPDCVGDWEAAWTAEVGTTVLADKPLSSSSAYPTCETWHFDPFTIYTPLSEVEVQPDLARRLSADAQKAHESRFSAAIARALYNPEDIGGLPYLPPFIQDTDRNPTLGYANNVAGTYDPVAAYAMLLALYAGRAGTTGGAMVHVSPVVLPYLLSNSVVVAAGQRYVGGGGVIVVADAGYPMGEVARDVINDSFGTNEPLLPESTMFVTGPVEVAYDSARTIDGGMVADTRWNQWALLIEQRAIFRFDPFYAYGVTVCAPQTPCTNYSSVQ